MNFKMPSSHFVDLSGTIFGRLKVIKRVEDYISPKGARIPNFLCKCSCGKTIIVKSSSLKSGNTTSCGCYNKESTRQHLFKNISGERFGNILVLEYSGKTKSGQAVFSCICDCGKIFQCVGSDIRRKHTTSCGCRKESYVATELKYFFSKNHDAVLEYKCVKNPKTGKYLPYDIYLPESYIFIEINGKQHYEYTEYFHANKEKFLYNVEIDKIKREFAKRNGLFIEIDLRQNKSVENWIEYVEKIISSLS